MINSSELEKLYEYYPVLYDLPGQLRGGLHAAAHPINLSAGQTLFEVGSRCAEYLMVLIGTVRVVKPSVHGREILLYRVKPGTVCILTVGCLLENVNYAGRGVIESDLEGVLLPRTLFLSLLDSSQPFRLHIFRSFSQRFFHLAELVEEVAFGKLDRRLASTLLARGSVILVTHQQLAEELGSSREVISRILEGFEENGIMALERGEIHILDRNALGKIAGVGDLGYRQMSSF